ncbi:unnamed protein product [Prunus armeniaca]
MEAKGLFLYYKSKNSPNAPETDESYVYDLTLEYQEANSSTSGNIFLDVPKFNSTLTYLKLGIVGNIKLYTYYDKCVAFPLAKGLLGWNKTCEHEKVTSCKATSFHYHKVEGVDHFLSKYTRGSSTKEIDCGKKCTSDCKCLGYFYNQDTSVGAYGCRMKRERHKDAEGREMGTKMPKEAKGTMVPVKIGDIIKVLDVNFNALMNFKIECGKLREDIEMLQDQVMDLELEIGMLT